MSSRELSGTVSNKQDKNIEEQPGSVSSNRKYSGTVGKKTKAVTAKSNPAKIDLFEIKLDQKANQIIKHALISSIHQDEGYLLHRFLNSLNSFVNTIKEQEQAKVTEMLQNVNENNNSVFP